jgi:hypothetical protein
MGRGFFSLPILLFLKKIAETEDDDVKKESYVMTLCPKCRAAFENAGENHLRRVNPNQAYKEKCVYCNVRNGYDYEIIPKDQKEGR